MSMNFALKYDHQIRRAHSQMLTLSLSNLQQHRHRGTNLACIHWHCLKHDKIADDPKCSTLANLLSHALFDFVTARATAFTVHKMSRRPIRASYGMKKLSTYIGQLSHDLEVAELQDTANVLIPSPMNSKTCFGAQVHTLTVVTIHETLVRRNGAALKHHFGRNV